MQASVIMVRFWGLQVKKYVPVDFPMDLVIIISPDSKMLNLEIFCRALYEIRILLSTKIHKNDTKIMIFAY